MCHFTYHTRKFSLSGTIPNTEWLKDTCIELTDRGHIKVNQYNCTTKDNVYAAGDCCSFPLFLTNGEPANISHYQMALALG